MILDNQWNKKPRVSWNFLMFRHEINGFKSEETLKIFDF